MARKKKRRIRSPHPGVVILRRTLPAGGTAWRARFRDPDTGKLVYDTLDPQELSTHEARADWAKRKSRALAKRRTEIASGAPLKTHTPLPKAVDDYLKACADRLRPSTVETYQKGVDKLVTWCGENGIATTEQLTPGRLELFAASLAAARKRKAKAKNGRGAKRQTAERLSRFSVARDVRSVKALAFYWRRQGVLPHCTKEDITAALKAAPGEPDPPAYLTPTQIKKLLERAVAHDDAVFKATRREHRGLSPAGSTPRYMPVAPLILTALLTGMRIGELENLRWDRVDLEALDSQGRKAGEIRLTPADTKTSRSRVIDLGIAPTARVLLSALRLQAGKIEERPYVFGPEGKRPLPHTAVESARKRLIGEYNAPAFSSQGLRQTCTTYLVCSSIYGGASIFLAAKRSGHSVQVCEHFYAGTLRGLDPQAKTLEEVMRVKKAAAKVVTRIYRASHRAKAKQPRARRQKRGAA